MYEKLGSPLLNNITKRGTAKGNMKNNRPEFVTEEDIKRWDTNMDNDNDTFCAGLYKDPTIREVCYSGLWLCEQLEDLKCPPEYITRIQYTAGRCSFGRDPWEVHQEFLESYKLNKLEFEQDPDNIN